MTMAIMLLMAVSHCKRYKYGAASNGAGFCIVWLLWLKVSASGIAILDYAVKSGLLCLMTPLISDVEGHQNFSCVLFVITFSIRGPS